MPAKKERPGARRRSDTTLDVMTFRIAADEIETIKAAAAADGMTTSAWLRHFALAFAHSSLQQKEEKLRWEE